MNVALITGALGGIGKALCQEFRKSGYYVIGTDRRTGNCESDAFLHLDVRELCHSEATRAEAKRRICELLAGRPLKVLINNAATQILNRTNEIQMDDWNQTLETNLIAPFLLIQLLARELEDAKGSVVNVASIHAAATKPGFVCYATSKAALVGMTRALAVDLGRRIRVNAINPAATATPMLRASFQDREEDFRELARMHPLERIAQPDEIAHAAIFLASDRANFITGSCLHIDGGMGARLHDPI